MTTHNNETRGAGGSAACPMYPHLRPTELLLSSSTTNTRLRKSKSRFGQHPTHLHGLHISVLGFVALAVASSPAWALLGGRSVQTGLQSTTGTAVQAVCGNFAAGNPTPPPGSLQEDLFFRCREMVNTANDLDGGAAPFTLDLTEQQLAAALQQLATEEIATPRTMATETSANQLGTLAARLTALRAGATGFAASGLGFAGAEQRLGAATLGLIPRAGERGGAAAADEAFSKLSGFINGIVSSGDKDATDREDGFDFDTVGITLGVDYRFTDKFVFGGALDFTDTDNDFDRSGSATNPIVGGGGVESDGFTLSGYGTYYLNKYYIDGIVSFGEHDHDLTRRILYTPGPGVPGSCTTCGVVDRTATGDTESDLFSLTIGGGYETSRDALTYGAYARLSYLEVDIDGYTEQGALGLDLIVDDQEVESLVSIIGGRISKAFSRRFGVLIPQGWIEWHHEFEDDTNTIVTRYANDPNALSLLVRTDDPDEDFFVLGGGVSAVFKGGTQAFVDVQTVQELDDVTNTILTAGVRREF